MNLFDVVSKPDYSNPVSGFTKLFESIIHSTVWETEMHVKITWITMLAMANRNGDVCASVPGLAKAAGVSLAQVLDALKILSSPDKWSRTKAHEGRRIEEMEGGWHLLNYTKYREQRDADERRIQTREAVARHRRKSADVSNVSHGKPRKAQAEAEAEAETTKARKAKSTTLIIPPGFEAFWSAYPRKIGKRAAMTAWARLKVNGSFDKVLAAVEQQKRSEQWMRDGGQFIPHPATWLNQGRWDDEPASAIAPSLRVVGPRTV